MAEPTPTIYSYYSPTVQGIVQTALIELNRSDGIHKTLKQNYSPGLDTLHLPLMEKYEAFARSEGVIGLDTLDYKYFTNGSSEGITHLITSLLPAETLYQFKGEYQGYKAQADAVGRTIITVKDTQDLMVRSPGILIVSNPMSRDGRIINNQMIREVTERHRVIIDLAYMGATQAPLNLDLTNEKIIAVLGSLSKPFGLYYYRIGFCYSRYPIASLYGNKWFKNALSIKIGEAILDYFNPTKLRAFKDHCFNLQDDAVSEANRHFGLGTYSPQFQIQASPVWLLGTLIRQGPDGAHYDPNDLRPFKRLDGFNDYAPSIWRFCLTPYYMEKEY